MQVEHFGNNVKPPELLKVGQSGLISPNLVTLTEAEALSNVRATQSDTEPSTDTPSSRLLIHNKAESAGGDMGWVEGVGG